MQIMVTLCSVSDGIVKLLLPNQMIFNNVIAFKKSHMHKKTTQYTKY